MTHLIVLVFCFMWFDFINLIWSFFCRLFTKENGLGWRVEGLKPNVPNQEDDPHNSPETRPTLCVPARLKIPDILLFSMILHHCIASCRSLYHSFLLFKSLDGCHRCYYRDVALYFPAIVVNKTPIVLIHMFFFF